MARVTIQSATIRNWYIWFQQRKQQLEKESS